MTQTEFELFKKVNQQAKEAGADDILAYFKENMSESLYCDIHNKIEREIRYRDAAEIVQREGINCFEYMDEEEYDAMSSEELIARFMDDNIEGIYEFLIEKIEIK